MIHVMDRWRMLMAAFIACTVLAGCVGDITLAPTIAPECVPQTVAFAAADQEGDHVWWTVCWVPDAEPIALILARDDWQWTCWQWTPPEDEEDVQQADDDQPRPVELPRRAIPLDDLGEDDRLAFAALEELARKGREPDAMIRRLYVLTVIAEEGHRSRQEQSDFQQAASDALHRFGWGEDADLPGLWRAPIVTGAHRAEPAETQR